MQYMNKLFYNLGSSENRLKKLEERKSYDSTLKIDLYIKPEKQKNKYSLYYVPTIETMNLMKKISLDDKKIVNLYENLPNRAKESFYIDIVSSEIQNTNNIEGVKSSREDIVNTTKKVVTNNINDDLKFLSIVKSYAAIKDIDENSLNYNLKYNKINGFDKFNKNIKDIYDIRKIYDKITADGVDEENLPDGEVFRKGSVYIQGKNGTLHSGVSDNENSEPIIKNLLSKLIDFMNEEECTLVKNAIFHYYFGYIHPFYDGNGRTARFISSLILKEDYSWLTACSLSQGVNKKRSLYLKAFEYTNNLSMQGEMNFFIDSFLSLINIGQCEILENLNNKTILLEEAYKIINSDKRVICDDKIYKIVDVAIQIYLFGNNDYLEVKDIENLIDCKNTTARTYANKLCEMNIMKKISQKPMRLVINSDYIG